MAFYELVREIPNLCRNNQMRDVFFDEVETDSPESYVRNFLKDSDVELLIDAKQENGLSVIDKPLFHGCRTGPKKARMLEK